MGFAVQNEDGGTYVAGWVQMAYDFSAGNVSNGSDVTIMDWAFNTGDVNTSTTIPASGGGTPVPGIGGLAGLAMGAAGQRRKRQRAARPRRVLNSKSDDRITGPIHDVDRTGFSFAHEIPAHGGDDPAVPTVWGPGVRVLQA